jgi:tripartite-type tricarboxylate transporter receptor subunit TctC
MKLPRRRFLRLAAGVVVFPAVTRIARAQSYPTRPVRLIVGFAAGGPVDIAARVIGQWLSERLGQPFVVENRPGASGNIATETVVNASADAHTLLLMGASNTINPALYSKLNFNFLRDIVPIAGIMRSTLVLLVNPSFGPKTVPELIAFAKTNPGKINMASGGTGTSSHMAGELFKAMADVDMLHLPYRGESLALNDLLGGQVQMMFGNMSSSLEFVRTDKLRALAVTTAARSEVLPELPTVGDFVPDYEVSGMNGIGGPRNLPAEVIDKLNKVVNAGLADSKLKARLADLGGTPIPGSPTDYGKLLSGEVEKWSKLIRASNIKPD